jgi:pyruvate kinase
VNSIDDDDDDSTAEVAIQEMIEAAQRMIRVNNSEGEEEPEITINPAIKRHFELEIKRRCKMLQEMKVN